ncbi:MAG: zinc-binding alcohol dehydrogenase [Oscillospiraceae bacterium]|nr:zinc-binding alcohol dehydrogenase [Oscillospiraceae bacterium]
MTDRRVLFTAPGIAELVEQECKPLAPDRVRVETAFSTISSGTERARLTGEPNIDPTSAKDPPVVFPRTGGYSSAGTVVEVGSAVTDLAVGDRVALLGGHHGTHVAVTRENVFPIGGKVPFQEASMWHIAVFPLGAVRKCRVELGESALVMGQGVLGQMAVRLLRLAGAAPILAADPVPEKRQRALALGADYALDPFAPDFAEQVKALTGGGARVCIEVTGNGKALDGALDCMARFGRVALLGCTRRSDFSIDYYRKVHWPGITLIGAHSGARPELESHAGWWTEKDDVAAIRRLYELGRLQFSDMVEEVHSPLDVPEVFARLAKEKSFPLVQFDWGLLQ